MLFSLFFRVIVKKKFKKGPKLEELDYEFIEYNDETTENDTISENDHIIEQIDVDFMVEIGVEDHDRVLVTVE